MVCPHPTYAWVISAALTVVYTHNKAKETVVMDYGGALLRCCGRSPDRATDLTDRSPTSLGNVSRYFVRQKHLMKAASKMRGATRHTGAVRGAGWSVLSE